MDVSHSFSCNCVRCYLRDGTDLFYKYDLYLEMFFILNIMMRVTESLNCSVCCSKGSEPIFSDILYSFSEFPACSVVNPTPELFSFFVTKMSFVRERKCCLWKKSRALFH